MTCENSVRLVQAWAQRRVAYNLSSEFNSHICTNILLRYLYNPYAI